MLNKTKLSSLTLALAVSLSTSAGIAKTFDPDLRTIINQADDATLHAVIVTFEQSEAPSASQVAFLEQLGLNGVVLKELPMAGVLATRAQIETIYQREDVRSVWHNDPLSLENGDATAITGVQNLRADTSLRNNGIPFSGRGIGVVINDSGVDGTHGDLMYPQHVVQNVLAQVNLNSLSGMLPITYQENVANTDILGGHGTHVAGTVGGSGSMSNGEHTGVAPGASLIGYGSGAGLFILDTLGGFDYALHNQFTYNIRVISNSFGNTGDVGTDFNPDDPTNVATKKLADNGVITVFSAGNSGPGESTITGNFKKAPWVITVAAGDKSGKLADFSSRGVDGKSGQVEVDGETYTWEDRPTITAPGVDIISARASLSSLGGLSAQQDAEEIPPEQLAYYTISSGTSMAAPHVSGVVALILEANPNLQWQQVKSIIQDTATVMPGRDSWEAGAGYINAHAAVKAAVAGSESFGDTVKQNRSFNANAELSEGDSFTRTVEYFPVGTTASETFVVDEKATLVLASAQIESGTAFVLEDPQGNQYGSGIGLPVLGSSVGVSAPAMAGTWKVYARGIGSVSGLSLDPLGVTNGIGLPVPTEVSIRTVESAGIEGIDDTFNHPARAFIELAINERLMDARSGGFSPDAPLSKLEFADALSLSGLLRQSQQGATQHYVDTFGTSAAFANAASATNAALLGGADSTAALVEANSAQWFGAGDNVSRVEVAFALVQALGLEELAASFDPEQPIQVTRFDQIIELEDSFTIPADKRGHVQLALNLGLAQVELDVEQGAFDLTPQLSASFGPQQVVTRAELARDLSQLLQRIGN
ncbi:S8 family serine peptidase [Pseudidiomarina sp. 1APP75-27a]|uniref:S8 family serine peptidase n=1 Tax=Pseudidiomarina terrestris TaxID=2820060 RepID=UPI002B055570|nr:S8 family serine peptidase [Pseudidiomarina sp. 1APP75-27a]MEA3589129.1 S8 family serine peptidase [Pseudidiomarina sp. 1APP75-27a]